MRTGVVVTIGLISAGLVIGGTIWYFKNKSPKKSSTGDSTDDNKGEDIPDTTKPASSSSQQVNVSEPTPKKQTTTTSGGGSTATATATSGSTLDNLVKKLGSGARLKNNQVYAPFNSNKHLAIFYSNGRFSIFKIGEEKKGYLVKGAFRNDGLTLIPDKGKQISSGSVWTNLNNLPIKK